MRSPRLEPGALLQPGAEGARQPLELAIGQAAAHAAVGDCDPRNCSQAVLDQRLERGVLVADRCRPAYPADTAGTRIYPCSLDVPPALSGRASSVAACCSSGLSTGQTLSSNNGCPRSLGCRPSACISAGLSRRRRSSKNGTSGDVVRVRQYRVHGRERPGCSARRSWAACACPAAARDRAAPARQRDHGVEVVRGCWSSGRPRRPSLAPSSRITMRGCVHGQRARQAGQAAGGGLAADAGVHDLESVPFLRDLLRQQTHPALIDADAVTGAEAVAEHQDRPAPARRPRRPAAARPTA